LADIVAKLPKHGITNFPRKGETSENRRSMDPTKLFDRRAYGSENLNFMLQKDFCNNIGVKKILHTPTSVSFSNSESD
jgi:hypothetical protein